MFKELVDAVQDGVRNELVEIGGETFSTQMLRRIPKIDLANPLDVATLRGIVDYLGKNVDENGDKKLFIHVARHDTVNLVRYLDDDNRRETLISAGYTNDTFRFGAAYGQSDFITVVQSQFEDAGDRAKLLKLVGSLTDESSLHLEDDGLSQKTTAKTGLTTKERIETPNPFNLVPYRTFSEVAQPASAFILRMHRKEGSAPTVSLHESDNQGWKVTAIKTIKTFFEKEAKGIPVIA